MSTDRPIQRILQTLENVTRHKPTRNSNGWQSLCPAHDDHNPSLNITVGDDGRVLVHCFAGCSTESVVQALGLRMADLMLSSGTGYSIRNKPVKTKKSINVFQSLDDAIKYQTKIINSRSTVRYQYSDNLWMVRFDLSPGEKTFRPFRYNGASWVCGDPEGPLPLYRADEIRPDKPIWIPEGEKCTDALRSIGLNATCSAHGAKSPHKTDWTLLVGREVFICVDKNEAGRKYGQMVAAILLKLGCRVKIIELPSSEITEGQDVADWIEARDSTEPDDLQHYLESLAATTPEFHFDSNAEPIEDERAGIELWPPIPASQLGDSTPPAWLWTGYLAVGFVTLLTGLWKAGKTTLIVWLLKAFNIGGELGTGVASARALVISEEGAGLWRIRRDRDGIGDNVDFIIKPFKGRPDFPQWQSFIAHVSDLINERKYSVVIIDTFAGLGPVYKENDAGEMMTALMPLHQLTEAGAAVLLIHHPRKGDATEGQASRGSGALPGFVDTIIELRRYSAEDREDKRRVLTSYGRFDETPPEMVIELTEDGYQSVGSKADAKRLDRIEVISGLLSNKPVIAEEILNQWPSDGTVPKPGLKTIRNDLKYGTTIGLWQETGAGKKGDPLRYFITDSIPASSISYMPESNSECITEIDLVDDKGKQDVGTADGTAWAGR